MNPVDHIDRIITYAADHRNQLLKEAATERLWQAAKQQQPSPANRVLTGVGDLLIATGTWLKEFSHTSVRPLR